MQEEEVRGPIELTEERVDEPSDIEENEEGNWYVYNIVVWMIFCGSLESWRLQVCYTAYKNYSNYSTIPLQ